MSLYLRTACVGSAVAALLAASAMAAPPDWKQQNRIYGNSVYATSCSQIENGEFCRNVSASENYDVKGTFEYTDASINQWRYQYDPNDGSYVYGNRYLSCPVDRNTISATQQGVTMQAVLDPGAPGCYMDGYIESYDPVNGYRFEPWLFPVPITIAGEWLDPFTYNETMSNHKNTYYDGWSGTTTKNVEHCKYKYGDYMQAGGFSTNNRSFEFDGPNGTAFGFYNLSSCNSNVKQR